MERSRSLKRRGGEVGTETRERMLYTEGTFSRILRISLVVLFSYILQLLTDKFVFVSLDSVCVCVHAGETTEMADRGARVEASLWYRI